MSTLQRQEVGDPGVSIGIVASSLRLDRRDSELRNLAAPENEDCALSLNVRETTELGRA
ncbi:hypothetical protein OOZ63_04735 [Paucibacter sp. PLA-PC-4]|uniref:hypothetical protein n=1 Tax=Paucibacter sp. PLA-PC-4 TaxID=2993655 RepID=UPI0022497B35|nr:hypothetical protein [Paucibacter sp. PLA-PC-4]MCX2861143.1 hypothetical protein [Paucibacter sp. PLA-PC-4]